MRPVNPVERAFDALEKSARSFIGCINAPVRWVHGWAAVFVGAWTCLLYIDQTLDGDEWAYLALSILAMLHMHARHGIGWSGHRQAVFQFRMNGELAFQATVPFLLLMVLHLAAITFDTPRPGLAISASLYMLTVFLFLEEIFYIAPAAALHKLWRVLTVRRPR